MEPNENKDSTIIVQPTDNTPQTNIEVQAPQPRPLGWETVYSGIASGSWAVLLVLFLAFFYLQKPLGSYLAKQIEVLDRVKDNLEASTGTLKQMSEDLKEVREDHRDEHKTIIDLLNQLLRHYPKP